MQETIERNQTELAAQKEFYANALNAAKEAEALAEARANSEAKIELESRLREAGEKEAMLVQTLEELRHTLTRKEQEVAAEARYLVFYVITVSVFVASLIEMIITYIGIFAWDVQSFINMSLHENSLF